MYKTKSIIGTVFIFLSGGAIGFYIFGLMNTVYNWIALMGTFGFALFSFYIGLNLIKSSTKTEDKND